ncbi:class I SAM-dependent RNA methyltransferase [Leptospira biflexa]|uniref:Putative RNA methyltransferase n=1 Tax=Leptospira biflexa serovar Patoc (strain Patoc 1 / ATCC 23582 / Paris) TaxID=456481 RepID=B0SL10_LEPBP|nr:class I SAM-dependent RNA methyltransferase [Leptospira biflexa]ABZ94834.1 SAM-dependent methyltransferase [Leptospira biflexa serovar Patoc strain 'Patoc 1 (Ames)']ABZ98503.1 Putative RNA methyltransferase [Leptospira biflexa serovar Patoc strain 'Patoc 1 (Paris)']TGM31118.1 class I SAM-dependent RNA methyltransferase [Leptospira biflexa]TGM34545.1 class I SAM-dependent RNA methyltransferase [Leptospira biflexa]TGM44000.1 class I SAM-dependent RNA methyltransferase [Leptospira biflexa]
MDKVKVEGLNSDFSGIVTAPNGKKVDIFFVHPGDELVVEYVKRRPRQRSLKIHEIIRNHNWDLVKCNVFGKCGGCTGQHIPYETQLELKFKPILDSFQRDLGISITPTPQSKTYAYRSRMDFSVFPGPVIGQRQRGNFRNVVPIQECSIQSDWANQALQNVQTLLHKFPEIIWDRRSEEGGLKYLTIRKAQNTDDGILIFTFTDGYENHPRMENFRTECLESLSQESILFCYNRPKSEVSAVGRAEILRGKQSYTESVLGHFFEVPFDSFFQPNPNGFLPILNFIKDLIPQNQINLIDLFCGNGFFSLLYGDLFQHVEGYELTESSIQIASNLFSETYPSKSHSFQVTNLFLSTETLSKKENATLILDPPRAGAGKLVNHWIRDFGPEFVFYVSCNPYSQKEDVSSFLSAYEYVDGILIDPYPHTPHTESVLFFRRKHR